MADADPLFMFHSTSKDDIYGFTSDHKGDKLPVKFAPWKYLGVIRGDQPAPHRLDRSAIETSIREVGFQLWRKKAAVKPA